MVEQGRMMPDSVRQNLLRLAVEHDGITPDSEVVQLSPAEAAEWGRRFGVTMAELETLPDQLETSLTDALHGAVMTDAEEAVARLEGVQREARRLAFPTLVGEADMALAEAHRGRGNLAQAIASGLDALGSPLTNDRERRAAVLLCLGRCFQDAGQFTVALAIYQSTVDVVPPRSVERAAGLINWGTTLGVLGNYGRALEVYQDARALCVELGDRHLEAWALIGIVAAGICLDPDAARPALSRATALAKQEGFQDVLQAARVNRVWLQVASERHVSSRQMQSLDPSSRADVYETLARAGYQEERYDQCLEHAEEGLNALSQVTEAPLSLKIRLLWWRALSSRVLGRAAALTWKEWAEDLCRATLSDPLLHDLPPWPEEGTLDPT